jgi:uncharacterized protein (TIGR03437 family)
MRPLPLLSIVIALAAPSCAATVTWAGQVWTISGTGATAVVNAQGHLVLTKGAADADVRVARILPGATTSFINQYGTPRLTLSYVDPGEPLNADLFVQSNVLSARLQAGTLFMYQGLGYARYGSPAQDKVVFATGTNLRAAGQTHTLTVGQRADGTVDYIFDGVASTTTHLKDNVGPFPFNEVLLRLRSGPAGSSLTFTAFTYSDSHTPPADLSITKAHSGNFTAGQTGALYTITVANVGGPTAGMVTVTDALPAGLTATSINGSGWACTLGSLTCTRSDVLPGGTSYPPITLAATVALNAPASVTNVATVSGGGDATAANNSATDPATIVALPELSIAKTHSGSFIRGRAGATYTITVANSGGPTAGTVTVTDVLPAGLTATSINGSGWSCTVGTLICTRSDMLPGGASYPAITLAASVAADAPASVLNIATVSGGGDITAGNNSASDAATVLPAPKVTLSSVSATVPSRESTHQIQVAAPFPDHAWSVSTASDWITIRSAALSIGSGAVDYSVSTNTQASDRTGTIVIDGIAFTVTQTKGIAAVVLNPTSLTATGVRGGVTVSRTISIQSADTGLPYAITVAPPAPWLRFDKTSGSVPAELVLTFDPAGLAAGSHQASVKINDAALAVTFTVSKPSVSLSQDALFFQRLSSAMAIAPQILDLMTNGERLPFTAGVDSASAKWLSIFPSAGTVPGAITVSVNAEQLSAGENTGRLTIAIPGAAVPEISVPVVLRVPMLTIAARPNPALAMQQVVTDLSAGQIHVTHTSGLTSPVQTIPLEVSGGELDISYEAGVTPIDGAGWVSVDPAYGETPGEIRIRTDATSLPPGHYRSYVTLKPTGLLVKRSAPHKERQEAGVTTERGVSTPAPPGNAVTSAIAVLLHVTHAIASVTRASPSFLDFRVERGHMASPARIQLSGVDGVNYRSISDRNWISISASSQTLPSTLTVAVDTNPLPPGTHTGKISITSTGSLNGPLIIPVSVTITAALQPIQLDTSGFFLGAEAGSSPATATLNVSSPAGGVAFIASSSEPWLRMSANSGVTPASLRIQADPAGLAARTYTATITVASGWQTAQVPVSFEVRARPVLLVSPRSLELPAQSGTASQEREVLLTSSGSPLTVARAASNVAWLTATAPANQTPARLRVATNEAAMSLPPGSYQAEITVFVAGSDNGSIAIPVTYTVTPKPPSIQPEAIAGLATGESGPIAPGLLLRVRGLDLHLTGVAHAHPDQEGKLPLSLAGAAVLFDGRPGALLRVSNSEIDVMAPYEIGNQESTAVQIRSNGRLSNPVLLPVAGSRPEILRIPEDPRSFARLITWEPVTGEMPAGPGSLITLAVSGLGAIVPYFESTQTPQSVVPALFAAPLRVMIAGEPADILFAGPMPGQAPGINQIILRVPENVSGEADLFVYAGEARSQPGMKLSVR